MRLVESTAVIFLLVAAVIGDQFEVYFQWKYINYSWPSWTVYEEAVRDGAYIKEHNSISGIKVWKDQVYLTVPRWRKGVPVTLATVSKNAETYPLLEPYPSWEMQRIGDCSALHSVQGIEIDPQGRMWVIDSGRVQVKTEHSRSTCPSRLMIFDIENNGEILLDYIFPESVTHFNSALLNNLVLDHESGGFAYITDYDEEQPGIVVFSLREKRSWKLFHESMRVDYKAPQLNFNGMPWIIETHAGGIALSPSSTEKGDRLVYYSPLTSYEIFSLPTDILKNNDTTNINLKIRNLGRKSSPSGGMIMSSTGNLYFGYLLENVIGIWNENRQSFMYGQKIWAHNVEWPDAFAIDEFQFLWNTAKRMSVIRDTIDSSKVNFRIIRSFVNSKNYQYYEGGRTPVLPEIAESSIFRTLFKNFRVSLSHVHKRAFSLS